MRSAPIKPPSSSHQVPFHLIAPRSQYNVFFFWFTGVLPQSQALLRLAAAYLSSEQHADAKDIAVRACEAEPSASAWVAVARACVALRQWEDAEDALAVRLSLCWVRHSDINLRMDMCLCGMQEANILNSVMPVRGACCCVERATGAAGHS